MKRLTTLAALAAALIPIGALAQTAPPAPPPGMAAPAHDGARLRPDWGQMREVREKMERLHRDARTNALAALTPAHRSALGGIIGNLAVSTTPDPRAAVRQIDGMLSSSEQQALVKIATDLREQTRATMEAAFTQMESQMSADDRARFDQRRENMGKHGEHMRSVDAGEFLLRVVAAPPHGMHEHGDRDHGPGGPGGMVGPDGPGGPPAHP